MIALLLAARPHTITPKLRTLGRWLAGALDAFAEARVLAAVSADLRRALRAVDGDDGRAHPTATHRRVTRRASSLVSPIAR